MKVSRRIALGLLASIPLMGRKTWAASGNFSGLAAPSGPVLLEVDGSISRTNDSERAVFDREMLANLDWVEVECYTPFTQGLQRFAGPTLMSLLDTVGANGATLQATAINDYSVEIPLSHAKLHGVILAMEHNGMPMRVRDKGPIWVVYPLKEREAQSKKFDTEMIWQLARLTVQ